MKVTLLMDKYQLDYVFDVKKILHDAYFDLEKPITRTDNLGALQVKFEGSIDESRYPLSATVQG